MNIMDNKQELEMAVKMIKSEIEKSPDWSFSRIFNEYNNTWYDGKLTIKDQSIVFNEITK